jgi:hypothetical protein
VISAEPIVAIALLTERDLARLGNTFERAYPIDGNEQFAELLQTLDTVRWAAPAK